MIADELHPESVAQSDENRPQAQPDSRLEKAPAQLADSQPAMQMRPAKSGGNLRERGQHCYLVRLRQPGQCVLRVWPYDDPQAGV